LRNARQKALELLKQEKKSREQNTVRRTLGRGSSLPLVLDPASHVQDSSPPTESSRPREKAPAARNFPQKYFKKVALFGEQKNHHPKPTLSPAIHHKFTTTNHHKTTRFLKNPLKKRPSATLEKNLQN
jgi:hypothetical protein